MRKDCGRSLCDGTEVWGCERCGIARKHPHLSDEVNRTMGILHLYPDADPEDHLADLAQRSFEVGLKTAKENASG